jgi:hypothetical protein
MDSVSFWRGNTSVGRLSSELRLVLVVCTSLKKNPHSGIRGVSTARRQLQLRVTFPSRKLFRSNHKHTHHALDEAAERAEIFANVFEWESAHGRSA